VTAIRGKGKYSFDPHITQAAANIRRGEGFLLGYAFQFQKLLYPPTGRSGPADLIIEHKRRTWILLDASRETT
jgi:hypothetical protein